MITENVLLRLLGESIALTIVGGISGIIGLWVLNLGFKDATDHVNIYGNDLSLIQFMMIFLFTGVVIYGIVRQLIRIDRGVNE